MLEVVLVIDAQFQLTGLGYCAQANLVRKRSGEHNFDRGRSDVMVSPPLAEAFACQTPSVCEDTVSIAIANTVMPIVVGGLKWSVAKG